MNILFLINELNIACGVTNYCYNLIKGLTGKSNCKVFVIVGGGNAIEKFERLNIDIVVNRCFNYSNRSYTNFLKSIFYLYKYTIKKNICLINAHHHFLSNIANKVKIISKKPVILSIHGLLPNIGRLNHYSADYFIVDNLHLFDYFTTQKIIKKEKIRLIRYGVTLDSKIRRTNLSSKIRIMSASRFDIDKGIDLFIKAISILPSQYLKDTEFSIVGDGTNKQDLIDLKNSVCTHIKYLGVVKNLRNKLFTNDIFVFPSRSNSEGFPISLVDAAIANNIIITSDFWGLDSIFVDRKDGFVFKLNDYNSLAQTIIFVLDNMEFARSTAMNFNNKVLKKFNYNKMIDTTLNYFEEILLNIGQE